jgi:hypothetical protein
MVGSLYPIETTTSDGGFSILDGVKKALEARTKTGDHLRIESAGDFFRNDRSVHAIAKQLFQVQLWILDFVWFRGVHIAQCAAKITFQAFRVGEIAKIQGAIELRQTEAPLESCHQCVSEVHRETGAERRQPLSRQRQEAQRISPVGRNFQTRQTESVFPPSQH